MVRQPAALLGALLEDALELLNSTRQRVHAREARWEFAALKSLSLRQEKQLTLARVRARACGTFGVSERLW